MFDVCAHATSTTIVELRNVQLRQQVENENEKSSDTWQPIWNREWSINEQSTSNGTYKQIIYNCIIIGFDVFSRFWYSLSLGHANDFVRFRFYRQSICFGIGNIDCILTITVEQPSNQATDSFQVIDCTYETIREWERKTKKHKGDFRKPKYAHSKNMQTMFQWDNYIENFN